MSFRRVLGVSLLVLASTVARVDGAAADGPCAPASCAQPQERTTTIDLRGHAQTLHLYGPADGIPVVVASGDGGWIHLGPHVAEVLAGRGYAVTGFDAKAYLSSFTSWSGGSLRPEDEPGDFQRLIAFAAHGTGRKVLLVGVSEGAGLSVLAATDPATRRLLRGVVGLGLGDVNELAWRWRDAIIYATKGNPREPSFSAASLVARMAPLPFAMIHSSRDEFVPVTEATAVMARAAEPKRLWIVQASNHRFSGNHPEFERTLLEALDWIHSQPAEMP